MNLTEVLQDEGKVLRQDVELILDSFEMPFGTYPIKEKKPVAMTVTNKGEHKLSLEGTTDLTVVIPCDRCLEPVDTPIHIDFELEVDMKLTDEQRLEALDESDYLHGYNLDVDKLVCGEALLNWPSRVLCTESCKGLCKVCGQNLNQKACGCDRTASDPRMAKIRDIFNMYKEV